MGLLSFLIIFIVLGIIFGLFMIFNPAWVIKMHIKTAAKANWRVEPISMEKELKSTKFRGINLIALSILAIMYIKLFII